MSGFGCKSTHFWNESDQLLSTLSKFPFLNVTIFETEVTICYPLYQNFHSLIDHIWASICFPKVKCWKHDNLESRKAFSGFSFL